MLFQYLMSINLNQKYLTKDEILNIINKYTPMIISDSEKKEYEKSNICHM
jgi:hypothetical protein